jgi:predicted DNA-binding transcriptional regulator AlpA
MGHRHEHTAGEGTSAESEMKAGEGHRPASVKPVALKCDTGDRQGPVAVVGLGRRDIAMLAAARARSAASDLLSITELAQQLDVSVRTIRRWQALGDAPPRVKRSRRLMYRLSDVMAWLDAAGRESSRK